MPEKFKNYRLKLSQELMIVIVAALIAAVFIYLILSGLTESYLNSRFSTEEYYQAEDAKIISSLQDYVKRYNVNSNDGVLLAQWVDSSPVSFITVYKNGDLMYLFDESSQKYRSKRQRETSYEQSISYSVTFNDGECDVILFGKYASGYYNVANLIKTAVPCIFFIGVVLFAVRKKVRYIALLEQDVDLLKSGEYDHHIHIEGRDELATLAESIDEMRQAYNQKIDEINRMSDESREFVTEMSHDMRTPMTPLLVYLGMLRDKRYETEEERENYVLKANEKAVQLKHMSDNMFASLLVNQRAEIELSVTNMNEAFYDQMSAVADYLGAEGFVIDARNVRPAGENVLVNLDFLARIFDNIMSNILKYADQGDPLQIYMNVETVEREEGDEEAPGLKEDLPEKYVVIRFVNRINELADYSSSTGFGVKNIRKMMEQMNAECVIDQQPEIYTIELRFPVVENEEPEEEDDGATEETGAGGNDLQEGPEETENRTPESAG